MLIIYFDEVKYELNRSPFQWLGGLIVNGETIWNLEKKVSDLAELIFQDRNLTKENEFHFHDIIQGKSNFKGISIEVRLDVIKKLIDILEEHEQSILRVFVRLIPANMYGQSIEQIAEKAFVYFVEKVEKILKQNKLPGILIGDKENDRISSQFANNLASFRNNKTPYYYGIKINNLIDTVHFTSSHSSRMLQLADIYISLNHLKSSQDNSKYIRKEIAEYIKDKKIMIPTMYKIWPISYV